MLGCDEQRTLGQQAGYELGKKSGEGDGEATFLQYKIMQVKWGIFLLVIMNSKTAFISESGAWKEALGDTE